MNTMLVVPDGVGVRNFVLGSFLPRLAGEARVDVLHAIPPPLLGTYRDLINSDRVSWFPLSPYRERPVPAMLRYSLAYAQMNWVGTRSMRFNATRPIQGSWRTRSLHRAARGAGRVAAFPAAIRLLERAHCAAVERAEPDRAYDALIAERRPSVVFCSHQRPPVILPVVLAARRAGVPTATFIFSWDNLSSKGRIAAPFDHYLVWSRVMRDELLRYYPDVAPSQVHVVGTPQFDPYGDPRLIMPRADFLNSLGADPDRPLICYSGGDTGNCPFDHEHVRILLQLIRDGAIRRRPQVVLRPSPADEGTRFDQVRRDYPELIYRPPHWIHARPGDWAHVFPLPEDVAMLANLTSHADLNVNFGSTMTLDFAQHGKPIVTPAFDVGAATAFGMPLYDFCLQFEHYRPVAALGAARFARSASELAAHINAYLDNPALDADGRRRLVNLHLDERAGIAGHRIVSTLRRIACAGAAPASAMPLERPA
jgi:hypothetical protein